MKKKIIIKASELFLNLGFKSVTMDDIANEMGISKKTIYKFFNNKEILVDNCVTYVHEKISASICELTNLGYNAIEENFAVKNMFKDIFGKSNTSPMHQLQKYYPIIFKRVMVEEFKIFEECVGTNIKKGIEQGLYRNDIEEVLALKFYFILVFGLHDDAVFKNKNYTMNELEIKVLEYHTRAIASAKGIKVLEKELKKIN